MPTPSFGFASRFQVAEFLLDAGLPDMDGVVYFDEGDNAVVLMRDGRVDVPLSECGLAPSRRFTFYDQVVAIDGLLLICMLILVMVSSHRFTQPVSISFSRATALL